MPSTWDVVPLKRVAALREERDVAGTAPLLSLKNTGELVARGDDVQPPSDEHRRRYWRVDPGDLVVNPMWLAGSAIGVSLASGAVSPDYRVYSLSGRLEPRFLHHLLRSVAYHDQYRLLMRAETTFDRRVTKEDFAELPVIAPPFGEQCAIAEFLDTETAQIDALIDARSNTARLVRERMWSMVDRTFADIGDRLQPLGRSIISACDGPFGSWLTSSHYVDDGARVIRLGNLGRAEFRNKDRAFIPLEHFAFLRRHEVVGGDLLVAGLGDDGNPLGRACVAPASVEPAIVKADCFRVRLDRSKVLPEFAAWWLSSPRGGAMVMESVRGSTRQRMNLSAVSRVRVPVPELSEQRELAGALDAVRRETTRMISAIDEQIGLLRERRQAIVAAAVTGQLEIAKAA